MSERRKTVFISYSHRDREWVEELTKFLAPWLREQRLALWDDSQIQPGAEWLQEIERALEEATVAVLLVTPDFLASDFVMDRELPTLLNRARRNKLRIAWVAVRHSAVETTALWNYQAVNDPSRPLATLGKSQRDEAMVGIAKKIADALTIGTFAGGLQIIDETTEPLEATLEGRPEAPQREYHIQAEYEAAADRISFRGARETITAEDLEQLPADDREFIADLEDSLRRNYQRWRAVRKGLGDAGGALDAEVENQLKRITKLICRDLNNILDFLRQMHKAELEDHYGRYRFICEELQTA